MSENETNSQLDTRRQKLQKIHKSTIDLQNLGALKYEETKPTFLPLFRPKHAIPQPLAPSAPPPTKKPKFLLFQTRKFCPVGFNTPGGPPSTSAGERAYVERLCHKLIFHRSDGC